MRCWPNERPVKAMVLLPVRLAPESGVGVGRAWLHAQAPGEGGGTQEALGGSREGAGSPPSSPCRLC